MLVENGLQAGVQLLALRQEIVELHFAQHRSKSGLRRLLHRVPEVLHLDDRLGRARDAIVDDGVDLQRHVVARDDVLRRHVPRHDAQGDFDDLVDWPEDEDQARSLFFLQHATQAEHDGALVFPHDVEAVEQPDDEGEEDEAGDAARQGEIGVHRSMLPPRGRR